MDFGSTNFSGFGFGFGFQIENGFGFGLGWVIAMDLDLDLLYKMDMDFGFGYFSFWIQLKTLAVFGGLLKGCLFVFSGLWIWFDWLDYNWDSLPLM